MGMKILWLVVSTSMALSLVVAACGPTVVEEKKPAPAPVVEEKKQTPVAEEKKQEAVAEKGVPKPAVERPKYGGILTRVFESEPRGFDDLPTPLHQATGQAPISHSLWIGDWARGPAGSGELEDVIGTRFDIMTGQLFESWELSETGRGVYKITPGIHYGLNPQLEASRLVGGREFTAYDAEFALTRLAKTPGSYQVNSAPEMARDVKITALDKYTLSIDIPPQESFEAHYFFGSFAFADTPREVIEKYGNMNDWKRTVGTGPFLMADYVKGSQLTYVKNPNYFRRNPAGQGKGDQMPYIDGMKILIVPDASTRVAALRTGKIDLLTGLEYYDTQSLIKQSPQFEYRLGYGSASAAFMRTDKADLPYKDIRVRQALTYATDFNAINEAINGGLGTIPGWPVNYGPGVAEFLFTLQERPKAAPAPQSVRELYTYNPEKAKQLLKEAGYPNGFKAQIIVSSAGSNVDEVAIFKNMWAKVGVDLEIVVKDPGTYTTISNARSHPDMIYAGFGGNQNWLRGFGSLKAGVAFNASYLNEDWVLKASDDFNAAWLKGDKDGQVRIAREVQERAMLGDWAITQPSKRSNTFWWPWVKNYYGASAGGFQSFPHQYLWIDQALKKSMGY